MTDQISRNADEQAAYEALRQAMSDFIGPLDSEDPMRAAFVEKGLLRRGFQITRIEMPNLVRGLLRNGPYGIKIIPPVKESEAS